MKTVQEIKSKFSFLIDYEIIRKTIRVTKMLEQHIKWYEKGIITHFQPQMMKRETECEYIFPASKPANYVKYAYA